MIEGPVRSLSPDDLASLERVMVVVGAPVSFAPPASAEDLEALEKALGRPLPRDLKTLYRWHDGARHFMPRGDLLSIAQCAAERAHIRRELGDVWHESPRLRDLVPLVQVDGDFLMVAFGEPGSSPIFRWSYWHPEPTPLYASLSHFVMVLDAAYRARAFYPDYDGWHEDHARLRQVEDSFQPVRAARRTEEARARCAVARDIQAPSMERQIALRALHYEPSAVDTLIELLDDRDAEVRRHAAFGLGKMHVRAALPKLLQMLEREPSIAADALAYVLTPEDSAVVPRLLPLLGHVDKQHRIAALNALATVRAPDAVPAVVEMLRDPDPGMYWYTIRVLAATRDARAVEPLRSLLERRDSLGLDPVHRGGTRGSAPTPELLRIAIENALKHILA